MHIFPDGITVLCKAWGRNGITVLCKTGTIYTTATQNGIAVLCKTGTIYTTATQNGITVLRKLWDHFTQRTVEMISQCYGECWDHLHNSHAKWYCNVLQTLGPFTWREGEWYHSVTQNLRTTYRTAWGNGITVWCKTCGPFTQHPEEMVTQCYTNLRTIYTMPRGKWYHTVRQNLGPIYTTPYVSPKMRSVWSQAAEHASVTWTKHGPEVWCHRHSERVVCLLGFQTTALRARQQMASNKCKLHSALLWSQGKRSSHLSLLQMTPVSQCSWNSIIMHLFVQNINRKKNMHVHCLSYSWNRISASRWSEIVFLLCLYVRS